VAFGSCPVEDIRELIAVPPKIEAALLAYADRYPKAASKSTASSNSAAMWLRNLSGWLMTMCLSTQRHRPNRTSVSQNLVSTLTANHRGGVIANEAEGKQPRLSLRATSPHRVVA
jgi:hypothetical protein